MSSTSPPLSTTIPSSKPSPPTTTTTTFTLRNPPYTYLHLQVTNPNNPTPTHSQPLDEITVRTHLSAALSQYLGITGTAIPIDIFKVESGSGEAWVRVPRDDERAVIAALSQWVGKGGVVVRVVERGSWLGGLVKEPGGGGD